jgi:hypothetical protein
MKNPITSLGIEPTTFLLVAYLTKEKQKPPEWPVDQ